MNQIEVLKEATLYRGWVLELSQLNCRKFVTIGLQTDVPFGNQGISREIRVGIEDRLGERMAL